MEEDRAPSAKSVPFESGMSSTQQTQAQVPLRLVIGPGEQALGDDSSPSNSLLPSSNDDDNLQKTIRSLLLEKEELLEETRSLRDALGALLWLPHHLLYA